CDAANMLYFVGTTYSTTGIATTGAHQPAPANPGHYDGMLAKFDASGQRVWATYYGGANIDEAVTLAIDNSGNVYIGGTTESDTGIATVGSHQPAKANAYEDAFVAKFNSAGVR